MLTHKVRKGRKRYDDGEIKMFQIKLNDHILTNIEKIPFIVIVWS